MADTITPGAGQGKPSRTPREKAVDSLTAVQDKLEKWLKDPSITAINSDNAVLAVGKIKGAIVKLTRE